MIEIAILNKLLLQCTVSNLPENSSQLTLKLKNTRLEILISKTEQFYLSILN
jgi:hypothetical protein